MVGGASFRRWTAGGVLGARACVFPVLWGASVLAGTEPGLVSMEVGGVAGTMAVTVLGGEIRVRLSFVNRSQRTVWLEKIEEGQAPDRAEFEIRSEGRSVACRHKEPAAGHRPLTRADFFKLEPGQQYQREVKIDDRYDFPDGGRDYLATHSFLTWNDKTRQAVFRSLRPVRFTYSR